MKALLKLKPEVGLWLNEVEIPAILEDEVLVKIKSTAICGTDLHIFNWDTWAQNTIPTPLTIGHEFVGEIVKLGAHVKQLKIGDRVSGEGHLNCGLCRNCRGTTQHLCSHTKGIGIQRNGAFAEYLSLPAKNVIKVPDKIPNDIAAIFDPLGNAVHTALAFDLTGEDVLITGAGPIGLMAVAIAKKAGARHVVITDINDYRLNMAKTLGATRTVNVAQETLENVMGELQIDTGFTVGLEMSGVQSAITSMLQVMYPSGKVALLGIPSSDITVNWNKIIFKGLTLKGIYGREMFETWYKMIALIQSGLDVFPVITHRFHAEEFEKAFEIARSGNAGKVILQWD